MSLNIPLNEWDQQEHSFWWQFSWFTWLTAEELQHAGVLYFGWAVESFGIRSVVGSSLDLGSNIYNIPNVEHIVFSAPFSHTATNNAMVHFL
jgi:hypothetical protein